MMLLFNFILHCDLTFDAAVGRVPRLLSFEHVPVIEPATLVLPSHCRKVIKHGEKMWSSSCFTFQQESVYGSYTNRPQRQPPSRGSTWSAVHRRSIF